MVILMGLLILEEGEWLKNCVSMANMYCGSYVCTKNELLAFYMEKEF